MSNNNDAKRSQIRAFFFPLRPPKKPDEPDLNDNGFSTLTCGLFVFMIVGAIVAIIIKDLPLGALSLLGGGALFVGLMWLDENVLKITEKQEKATKNHKRKVEEYERKKRERTKLLTKWGLTKEDLENQPTVSQIDKWLEDEDLPSVIQKALEKLNLTQRELVRDPMIIYGPLFWSTYGIPDDELVTVKITDGTLRFSCYQLVVVCLSKDRIATYSANFNFLRYAFLNEKTVEYLYRDIVSVSTEEKATNYNLPNGKVMRRAQIFRLAVPSGDNIEVVINSPDIKDLFNGNPKLSDHEQSVRAIREMMREKKR